MLLLSKATFSGIFQISIVFDQQFINLDVPLLTNTWNLLSILTHRKKHIQLFQKYIDTLFHTHYEKSIDLSHYWMCLFYSRVTVCVANIPLQWFCISIGNNREFLKKLKKQKKTNERTINRSSHRRCFIKMVLSKILQHFQQNICSRVSFLIKLQATASVSNACQVESSNSKKIITIFYSKILVGYYSKCVKMWVPNCYKL